MWSTFFEKFDKTVSSKFVKAWPLLPTNLSFARPLSTSSSSSSLTSSSLDEKGSAPSARLATAPGRFVRVRTPWDARSCHARNPSTLPNESCVEDARRPEVLLRRLAADVALERRGEAVEGVQVLDRVARHERRVLPFFSFARRRVLEALDERVPVREVLLRHGARVVGHVPNRGVSVVDCVLPIAAF